MTAPPQTPRGRGGGPTAFPLRADEAFRADQAVPERIRAYWTDLTIGSRRVAAVVLDHPRAALELTIGELAKRAGTSPATVTRFCRQLGYPGYTALRLTAAADLGSVRASAGLAASSPAEGADPTSAVEQVQERLLRRAVKDLQHVSTAVNLHQLEVVAGLVVRSRHVDVYGVGLSASDAAHLAARPHRRHRHPDAPAEGRGTCRRTTARC